MNEEILKLADLSNVKIGDTIWTIDSGEVTVSNISINNNYSIETSAGGTFTLNGKYAKTDKFPSAFIRNPFENINTFQEREMMVSNDNINWYKRNVFYKRNDLFLTDISRGRGRVFLGWKYAKEIEPKLKLTFEEIAKKFNTDVKNIEIIK
jgi:hypothetical protein